MVISSVLKSYCIILLFHGYKVSWFWHGALVFHHASFSVNIRNQLLSNMGNGIGDHESFSGSEGKDDKL